MKLNLQTTSILIISIYRSTTGNCIHFLNGLETILDLLHSAHIHLIFCGDIHINYLDSNCKKRATIRNSASHVQLN
jgi:hypothetical protein